MRQQLPDLPHLPAISTVHAVLDRYHLVKRRRRRRHTARGTVLSRPAAPNALWCADYKGEFRLTNQRYCYPLTITDFASRYLITCDALSSTQDKYAFAVFERAFKDFGLPLAIRSDNGLALASPNALYGLSRLSVWWLRLGIGIERIKPGHPEQNGRHERMHPTLKREATKPAAANLLQQQGRFDALLERYNQERPHQALGMKVPAEAYARSARVYRGLEEPTYPFHEHTITVSGRSASKAAISISVTCLRGRIWGGHRSASGSGSSLSCTTIWGNFDDGAFASSRSKIPSRRKCYLCARNNPSPV